VTSRWRMRAALGSIAADGSDDLCCRLGDTACVWMTEMRHVTVRVCNAHTKNIYTRLHLCMQFELSCLEQTVT
jgi:hypothetical protein